MATPSYILPGASALVGPVYITETGTRSEILPVVYLTETQTAAVTAPSGNNLPMMGVG